MKAVVKTQKVTVNLPVSLMKQAQKSSGKGITETIREGLQLVAARDPYRDFMTLKGKIPHLMSYEDLKALRE